MLERKVVMRKKGQKGFTEVKTAKGKSAEPSKKKRPYHRKTEAEKALATAEKAVRDRKREQTKKEKEKLEAKKKLKAEAKIQDKPTTTKKKGAPKKQKTPLDPWYNIPHDLNPWGLEVWAKAHSLSGNNAADIKPLLGRKIVVDALLKAAIRRLEIIIKNKDSLPEEIEAVAMEVKKYQKEQETYAAPLNVIDRDYQKQGSDGLPIPIISQHFIVAAFRDEISNSFPDEFLMAKVSEKEGRIGREHLRKFLKIYLFHLHLFKDPEMTQLFEASDIVIEGQQPVMKVAGFSFNEVLWGPIYFKFRIIFHPKGKFPRLADRELVQQVLYQCTFRGLGGRRPANYGQWEILKARYVEFKQPFIIIEGKGGEEQDARNTIPDKKRKQNVR